MPDDRLRLSKVVAARVPCSRREAEQYITEGRVRVDGETVREPQSRVADTQRIEIDRQAPLAAPGAVTVLLHKPAGLGTREAQALLTVPRGHGLTPLLELPAEASGLAVFSENRGIVRKLTEDAALVEQELIAEVAGTIAPDGLARLGRGLVRAGKPLPAAHVSWQNETRLRIAAKGIPPQWVPWMCEQVGLQLVALRRIRIGRIPMAGLAVGQWRPLAPGERF